MRSPVVWMPIRVNSSLPGRILILCTLIIPAAFQLGCRPSRVPKDVAVAERFVASLNAGSLQDMLALSDWPFVFRTQEWQSASDGSGFVHGKANDKTLPDKAQLDTLFRGLLGNVKIEHEKAAENPPSAQTMFMDNLKGAPAGWQGLTVFVFGRGFGDVEHVAIIGVDPTSHRVRGLYLN